MSTTTTTTVASQVRLSTEHLGICRGADIPTASLEVANRLLQKNHDENHVFWRDIAGHNHMAHSLLTVLALGASPSELHRAFEDIPFQRPLPDLDTQTVKDFSDNGKLYEQIGQIKQYTNFLVFFEQQIEEKGWRAVINEYCFSRSRVADAMLAGLYEGAYHPIIHLGLGVEFEQPSIIAEGLAQAATHDSSGIDVFLINSEQEALKSGRARPNKSLVELLHEVRENDTIHHAAHWDDFGNKVKKGVLGRAGQEMATLAAQFCVDSETLERKTAEMINCCAYISGAAQRSGKARKIDFFHMHAVTSSIFLTVFLRQLWISDETKMRLVEWKGRLDLVWYAASAAAELRVQDIDDYKGGPSADMDWTALYRAITAAHDDGHVAKFVRALKNGEEVSKAFEYGPGAEAFPVKGDMWLKLARMAYDSTLDVVPLEAKWVWGTGFDQSWAKVPTLIEATISSSTPQELETPFTTAALGSDVAFWKSYIAARPTPTENFFHLINAYHAGHGDPRTAVAHDVGTGPGNIAARLALYYDLVVGSDVNRDALAAAPALVPSKYLERMTFVNSPAEDLASGVTPDNVGRGKTDLVVVSECMPLLDAPKALQAFRTLLAPKGTLAIYFYGRPIFADGDIATCDAIYNRIATRICTFLLPFKGSPGFPFHSRAAEVLVSYMDNIAFLPDEWESVVRHKWNCDHPLLFNGKEGYDFEFEPVDRRGADDTTTEVIDRDFWAEEWDVERVKAYLASVFPHYAEKAGARYVEIEEMLEELRAAMGGGETRRKVSFPVVLILATKK